MIWERARAGADEFASRVFLTIAEPLLQTHFSTHEPKSKLSISVIQFDAPATPELLEFRETLWQRVFSLYQRPALKEEVLNLIQRHSHSGYQVKNQEIITRDAAKVQLFLGSALDASVYRDCVIVQDYLDVLDWLEINADEELRPRFTNDAYELSEMLLDDRKERRQLGWEEYERVRQERLAAYIERFDLADFEKFFERCGEILSASDRSRHEYQVHSSITRVLVQLAQHDAALFETVVDRYPPTLVQLIGSDRAYEILSTGNYAGKVAWLFGYFMALPPEAATRERLQILYEFYEEASCQELLRDLDYLLKFTAADQSVVIRVTRTLVEKARTEPNFGQALSDLFNEHSELSGKLQQIFAKHIGLLKEAYFYACEADQHNDYDGHAFDTLLTLDINFGREWVARMFTKKEWISRSDDSRNYMFLWRREDHCAVVEGLIEAVRAEGRGKFYSDSYLLNFFILHKGTKDIQEVSDRQDSFLDAIIELRHSDTGVMRMLFAVIRNLGRERLRNRLSTFIRHNQDFEAFGVLPLEPDSWSWSGSAVPVFQAEVDFLESLLPMLSTVKLLRHKQRI